MNKYYIVHHGELYHHGVKGMKWGVRKAKPTSGNRRRRGTHADDSYMSEEAIREARRRKAKKAVKIGAAAVAGTILVAYGAYKVSQFVQNRESAGSSWLALRGMNS